MLQLLKRDWMKSWPIILVLCILAFFIHLFKLPVISNFTYSFIILFAFTMNNRYEHRQLISLPVKRNHIVASKYLFVVVFCSLFLMYHLFLAEVIFKGEMVSPQFIVVSLFVVMYIAIAVSLPIYYLFQTVWHAVIIQFIVVLFGPLALLYISIVPWKIIELSVGQILDFISIVPYAFSIIIPLVLLVLSYWLSCRIFAKKDVS